MTHTLIILERIAPRFLVLMKASLRPMNVCAVLHSALVVSTLIDHRVAANGPSAAANGIVAAHCVVR
jgi:hypothetical protein